MSVELVHAPTTVNPWLSQMAVIDEIRPEIESVATYRLRLLDRAAAEAYRFLPGQFNMLYVPGCGESAISMSGDPSANGGQLVHTIRAVGRVTSAIAALRVGDRVGLRGPYGSSWPMEECLNRDVVIVAGGIGLAPLRPVILALLAQLDRVGRVVLLYGARSADNLLYTDEFKDWQRRGLEIKLTVDRASASWSGIIGVVPLLIDRLDRFVPDKTVLFTCGPEVMMDFSIRSARQRGLPGERVWLSMERNMQCAVGLCGHCQLGPTFVCRHGPVFRFDVIEPYLHMRDL